MRETLRLMGLTVSDADGVHRPHMNAAPPVQSAPLVDAYNRFKHLDNLFELVRDSDGTENSDPFHQAARDLWRAIKASLGHTANTSALLRRADEEETK